MRRLVKNGLIIKKPSKSVSRARLRQRNAMKRLGRHTGFGKRQGTREARRSSKSIWVERARVLRRLLVKYRAAKKIDSHLYVPHWAGTGDDDDDRTVRLHGAGP